MQKKEARNQGTGSAHLEGEEDRDQLTARSGKRVEQTC